MPLRFGAKPGSFLGEIAGLLAKNLGLMRKISSGLFERSQTVSVERFTGHVNPLPLLEHEVFRTSDLPHSKGNLHILESGLKRLT